MKKGIQILLSAITVICMFSCAIKSNKADGELALADENEKKPNINKDIRL